MKSVTIDRRLREIETSVPIIKTLADFVLWHAHGCKPGVRWDPSFRRLWLGSSFRGRRHDCMKAATAAGEFCTYRRHLYGKCAMDEGWLATTQSEILNNGKTGKAVIISERASRPLIHEPDRQAVNEAVQQIVKPSSTASTANVVSEKVDFVVVPKRGGLRPFGGYSDSIFDQ